MSKATASAPVSRRFLTGCLTWSLVFAVLTITLPCASAKNARGAAHGRKASLHGGKPPLHGRAPAASKYGATAGPRAGKLPRNSLSSFVRMRAAKAGTTSTTAPTIRGNYKAGLARFKIKGAVDSQGRTTGVNLNNYQSGRPRGSWSEYQTNVRNKMSARLAMSIEISHNLAHANGGLESMTSAFPATKHQNTEQLVVEQAYRRVVDEYTTQPGNQVEFRFKGTQYVHPGGEKAGELAFGRTKIDKKLDNGRWVTVVDHLMTGDRGPIDEKEAQQLNDKVLGQLRGASTAPRPTRRLKSPFRKGMASIAPPGKRDSAKFFTGSEKPTWFLGFNGSTPMPNAETYAKNILKRGAPSPPSSPRDPKRAKTASGRPGN